MKKLVLAFALWMGSGILCAQNSGNLGAGIILGDPMGLTAKFWFDNTRALDLGLGFTGDSSVYADFLWQSWSLFRQPKEGKLGAYAGIGGRLEVEEDSAFGIRVPFGANYWAPRNPIELFVELAPVFPLTSKRSTSLDAVLGARFYFN